MTVAIEGSCHPRFQRVRDAFEIAFEKNREVGAAIAFDLDGENVVDLWAGHVDKEKTQPWRHDTIVNTYSTTKGMTAICAARLVEQGRLDLDAPVADYWPEFAQAGKDELPVRYLLSHRAGLPTLRKPMPDESLYDWEAMTSALAAETPWWEPGTKQGYHAVTYGFLVGEVIRRVAGRTAGQMFREDIAEPLEADFQIGLPASEDGRVSDIIGSILPPKMPKKKADDPDAKSKKTEARIKGPMADFFREMADPTTMVGGAFGNPRQRRDAVNTRAWRAAEIPSANGHGNATALARIYGTLARGGERDGVRILEKESIDRTRTEQGFEPDLILGGMKIRYGLGWMLRSQTLPATPSPNAFGHAGAGGSLGVADPDARVGFGYVMNRLKPGLMGGVTAFAALDAFYAALE